MQLKLINHQKQMSSLLGKHSVILLKWVTNQHCSSARAKVWRLWLSSLHRTWHSLVEHQKLQVRCSVNSIAGTSSTVKRCLLIMMGKWTHQKEKFPKFSSNSISVTSKRELPMILKQNGSTLQTNLSRSNELKTCASKYLGEVHWVIFLTVTKRSTWSQLTG